MKYFALCLLGVGELAVLFFGLSMTGIFGSSGSHDPGLGFLVALVSGFASAAVLPGLIFGSLVLRRQKNPPAVADTALLWMVRTGYGSVLFLAVMILLSDM